MALTSVNWRVSRVPALFSTGILLCAALIFSGCRPSKSATPLSAGATQQAGVRRYHIRGIVVKSDARTGQLTVDTEAIPGYMEAMTMPYQLAQPNIASDLHPGDQIAATLVVGPNSDVLNEVVITALAKPDYKPVVTYNDIEPGETVPDFRLLNEKGQTISLRQFRGKVVLLTFIYTRCPLPDFCVRMSRNFAQIDKALEQDPALYAKTHLISVSFDPKYDTPKVLRSYGGSYTGRYTQETFTHWDFAAPTEQELPKVLEFFDVGATPEKDHTITHSLSTVVIAPDGKIAKWFPGNDWTPDEALAEVRKLVAAGA